MYRISTGTGSGEVLNIAKDKAIATCESGEGGRKEGNINQ